MIGAMVFGRIWLKMMRGVDWPMRDGRLHIFARLQRQHLAAHQPRHRRP